MKANELMKSATRTFHKVGFQLKKHSPEILVTVGVVGTVASAVMACKATTKASAILEEAKNGIDAIHKCAESPEFKDKYTEEDKKKDLAIVYAKTGLDFVKLYGPSVALGAASIACILTSHKIIKKRNVALAAAYTAVDSSFKDYRKRLVERFGKELDKELKYNIKAEEIEETVVNEDGTESTVKTTVQTANTKDFCSPYAVVYEAGCNGFEKDAEFNKFFLLKQQAHANDKLQSQGYLLLNDVYDMLGVPRTKAGHVVGWVYDPVNGTGDNYVDFGIDNIKNERTRAFLNCYEYNVLLDFNVDGNIFDIIKKF